MPGKEDVEGVPSRGNSICKVPEAGQEEAGQAQGIKQPVSPMLCMTEEMIQEETGAVGSWQVSQVTGETVSLHKHHRKSQEGFEWDPNMTAFARLREAKHLCRDHLVSGVQS